jgi:hypothetical protein
MKKKEIHTKSKVEKHENHKRRRVTSSAVAEDVNLGAT